MAVLLLSDSLSYLWFSLAGQSSLPGPKSVWVSPPCAKLLTVQEAQEERRGQSSSPAVTVSSEIEVEESPAAVPGNFHTVIDLPSKRPSSPSRRAESAAGSWCSCFCLHRPSSVAEHQLQSSAREPSEAEVVVLAGDSSPCVNGRCRADDDAASCASINIELLGSTGCCSSNDHYFM
ncbi:rho GTPase-activating protein 32-like [Coturnix japonica]|uniref:rho GTPase-activating protein 32-like n=1 Tax=Coturnix japonica TaxID=93934 RepID=UPI0013A5E4EB|nr:rho GTPase-activating protein 32-like [Coturnix japonica]